MKGWNYPRGTGLKKGSRALERQILLSGGKRETSKQGIVGRVNSKVKGLFEERGDLYLLGGHIERSLSNAWSGGSTDAPHKKKKRMRKGKKKPRNKRWTKRGDSLVTTLREDRDRKKNCRCPIGDSWKGLEEKRGTGKGTKVQGRWKAI